MFDVSAARAQFPSLQGAIYLDNPAGTQVSQRVIDAVVDYYRTSNANAGGTFATSHRTDAMVQQTREHLAAFLNANRPEEIVLGPNMTSLTFNLSRAMGHTFQPGDEIILTEMDHDANITPWVMMAQDHHLTIKWVRLDVEDGTLDLASYEQALNSRTKLVCVVHAGNALGTINPIAKMAEMAHAVGAQIFVDAVQSAPHLLIDVQAMDVDYLACSAYKFFGPHVGVLYGKYEWLDALKPYRVRPAGDKMPRKWETGTPSYETIAGTGAAIEYLASFAEDEQPLRQRLAQSYAHIREHENRLVWQLIDGLQSLPNVEIHGIVEAERHEERVPTVIFRLPNRTPQDIAQHLADRDIYVWSGHYYALETMRVLGHSDNGGMVRIGIAHYNTATEIERTLDLLESFAPDTQQNSR